MPLGGEALSAEEIDLIARWIDGMAVSEGAGNKQVEKPGWPWTRLQEPAVPPVRQQDWVANPIDAFVLSRLESKGLRPAPPASRRALLRRLYFGLVGLPPTPADMARFLEDSSPEAYSRAVERLLADSRYGERWGRHWLDLVRYADTRGGGLEYPRPHMWRYRDYVVRAFNQDRPYDRFIKEQLAGDAFRAYGDEGRIGASFLTLGVRVERSAAEGRRDVLIDVVDTTGETFLGVTLGCARCHDHKYDPIPTRDYYRLEAFFAPLTFSAKPLKFTQYEAPLQQPKWWKQKAEAWDGVLSERKKAAEAFKAGLKAREAPHYVLMSPQDLKDWVIPDLKRMPFAKGDFYTREDKDRLALITRQTARFANPSSPDYYKAMAYLTSDAPLRRAVATYVLKGGNLKLRGEEVKPGFLSTITGHSKPANMDGLGQSRRKLLAEVDRQWRQSPDGPGHGQPHLAAPFRRGPGEDGQRFRQERQRHPPSGPARLARLAVRGREAGASRRCTRLILHSSVYRQSVENPENTAFEEIDSLQPAALEAQSHSGPGRGHPRQPAFGKRQSESGDGWSALSPGGRGRVAEAFSHLVGALSPGRQEPAQPLHAADAVLPASYDDRLRRTQHLRAVAPSETSPPSPARSSPCSMEPSPTSRLRAMAARIRKEVGEDVALQVKRAFQLALQRDPRFF